jgi:transposase InsO family protein
VERYHRTLWQNLGEYSMKIDAQEYRLKLKMFENWYNYEKPHSGLGMFGMTPAEKIGYRLVSKTLRTARESEEP